MRPYCWRPVDCGLWLLGYPSHVAVTLSLLVALHNSALASALPGRAENGCITHLASSILPAAKQLSTSIERAAAILAKAQLNSGHYSTQGKNILSKI